ncbi:MAG: OmpH family outer membrane protein [Candidatus Hydrogenedentota bacterium]
MFFRGDDILKARSKKQEKEDFQMKTSKILLLISALFISNPMLYAVDLIKIGVIDMIKVGANYEAYQNSNEKLLDKRDEIQKVIEREEKRVMDMYQDYKNKVAVLSEEQKKEQEDLLEKEDKKLQEFVADQNKLLKREKEELDAKTKKDILKIVEEIATEQGLSVVLEKNLIVWSRPDFDITELVIEKLNATAQDSTKK